MKTLAFCIPLFNFGEYFFKTFPKNIKKIEQFYPHFRVSIGIYGGAKVEWNWLNKNYPNHRLIDISVQDNIYYNMSAAKNLAHFNAISDFVLNCDGDNILSDVYLKNVFVAFEALREDEQVLFRPIGPRICGRLGMWKSDFIMLGGYDPNITAYGKDDRDLATRAHNEGYRTIHIATSEMAREERLHNHARRRVPNIR